MADLKNILDRFGFVTVMEPEFYDYCADIRNYCQTAVNSLTDLYGA